LADALNWLVDEGFHAVAHFVRNSMMSKQSFIGQHSRLCRKSKYA
jgi:hypothetical protein